MLPADTFAEGPPSGAWLRARALGTPQFPSQPVQGVSSLWPAGGDDWWALSDNGYGVKANSSDYLLRIYRVTVNWGKDVHPGSVSVRSFIQLADPDRKLAFPITRELTKERWLTGADLDPESMVRLPDGTFWIGDEFGPFLLHFDQDGRLLDPPYELPGITGSPDHPRHPAPDMGQRSFAMVGRSRGFEGLAHLGRRLYPVLEAGQGSANVSDMSAIFEFDLDARAFTSQQWALKLPSAEHAVTEFVALSSALPGCAWRFLAIQRDGGHGGAAKLKRVIEVQLTGNSSRWQVVADLLHIANPQRVAGHAERFSFPFITTEAVWPLSRSELLLANDNNYPAGGGRPQYERDPTEFIRITLPAPVCDAW